MAQFHFVNKYILVYSYVHVIDNNISKYWSDAVLYVIPLIRLSDRFDMVSVWTFGPIPNFVFGNSINRLENTY